MAWLLVSLFILTPLISALFPGATPDEGDVRHLYPAVSISILLGEHSHLLPFLLGWVENIDYPKSRVDLSFYILPEASEDATVEQIRWWKGHASTLFHSLTTTETAMLDRLTWEEDALMKARSRQSSFLLLWKGDDLPDNSEWLKKIFVKSRPVLSYLLVKPPLDADNWNVYDLPNNLTKIEEQAPMSPMEEAVFPIIFNLDLQDSAYLTFDSGNIKFYKADGDASPLSVLSHSARSMGISILLDRSMDVGWHFHDGFSLQTRRATLRYLLADIAVDRKLPLLESKLVRFPVPQPSNLAFNRIYVINLVRRPERRKKMERICAILGINCTIFEATDGESIPTHYKIKQLPGYLDPFHKRPMKNGEVGCFLSHLRVWEEVERESLSRVLVLEDDGRFAEGGLERIKEMMEDIERDENRLQWDLIYVGRKRLKNQEHLEKWVNEYRHLSTVGYSYWTIGYALSLSGAKKLLEGNPLPSLVPVDEYIPIMADVHTNKEWSSAFKRRDLRAFTLHPLAVFPQRYTNEAGHVSDTEASHIIHDTQL